MAKPPLQSFQSIFHQIEDIFWRIPYKKYIAGILIFLLFFSQTFRIDFLDRASAGSEDYHDIVSIVIDKETYQTLRPLIGQYAEDIQKYLGNTRSVIFVTDANTTPEQIAAQNEKLYYEGDGEKGQSMLVGTILIGNIPIPMVEMDGTSFASIYPYVDFDQKTFIYQADSGRYEHADTMNARVDAVEIWHGVINPSAGNTWNGSTDIALIRQFLEKTHEFYMEQGVFAKEKIMDTPPKVFYYDGFVESKSVDAKSLFQYGLYIRNLENLAYNRYSKYLLSDINRAITAFDSANNAEYDDFLKSLGVDGGPSGMTEETIRTIPDIQTITAVNSFLKKFNAIFNKKVLGEELLAIHNAGRYNTGANVSADIGPVTMTITDEVANNTLKTANDALEKSIDEMIVSNGYARKIPIYDSVNSGFGYGQKLNYTNYYFGQKGKDITSPELCTISRGSSGKVQDFGRDILAEANVAFDVMTSSGQASKLVADTEIFAKYGVTCFDNNRANTTSYWGGNSVLRLSELIGTNGAASTNPLDLFPTPTQFTGFTESIFSLGGMKESTRLPVASLANCTDNTYQYLLTDPHEYLIGRMMGDAMIFRERRFYPEEWNRSSPIISTPRYSCLSNIAAIAPTFMSSGPTIYYEGSSSGLILPNVPIESAKIPVVPSDFFTEMLRYANKDQKCLVGTITIDGQTVRSLNNSCQFTVMGSADGDPILHDETTYRSIVYHTVGGILHHTSPTVEELAAAKANGTTPNLAIDTERYVEFITPKGNVAKLYYPNFYDATGTDIAGIRAWLTEQSASQWNAIIATENATSVDPTYAQIATQYLGAKSLPTTAPNWNDFISDEMIVQILQAKNWLHPDVSLKYSQLIESSLSYSHAAPGGDVTRDLPAIPRSKTEDYEIAYLGLTPFTPSGSEGDSEITDIQSAYQTGLASIYGYNLTNEALITGNSAGDTQCGPPEGVNIFQWPAAIMCWIQAQLPPKISAGQCGPNTIGTSSESGTPQNIVDVSYSNSLTEQLTALQGARAIPHFPRTHLSYYDSITFTSTIETNQGRLVPPYNTHGSIRITQVTSDGQVIPGSQYNMYFSLEPRDVSVGSDQSSFIFVSKGKNLTVDGTIEYTIPLLNGESRQLVSEPFHITVDARYLDMNFFQDNTPIGYLDGSKTGPVTLRVSERDHSNASTNESVSNFTVSIKDDITGGSIVSNQVVNGDTYTLPDSIVKNSGVYRILIVDSQGFGGEGTFSVRSGPLAKISLLPASSALIRGGSTVVGMSLEDASGNATSADLYSIDLTINDGEFIDATGNATKTMHLDMLDSYAALVVRPTGTENLTISAKTEDGSIAGSTTIRVYPKAEVKVDFLDADRTIRVGDGLVPARIRIIDENGQLIPGFNSVATWSLPTGAGQFDKKTLTIQNGTSEIFSYIPGSVAGRHELTLDIAGIGSVSGIALTLLAGQPLYIDHTIEGNQIIFTTRDRYGNLATYNGTGTLRRNADDAVEIRFTDGQYTIAKTSGYYIMDVPELAKNTLTYSDDSGQYTIEGIPQYAVYIQNSDVNFDFYQDYNARYTVLAGGAFLREAADILYHQTPGASQSLAVSTLLATPYVSNTIFSIFPGGGYHIGTSDTMALEARLGIEGGYPIVSIADLTGEREVARVRYQLRDAILQICQDSFESCLLPKNAATIAGVLESSDSLYDLTSSSGKITLTYAGQAVLVVNNNGSIVKASQVNLVLPSGDMNGGLTYEVEVAGEHVASIRYVLDARESVALGTTAVANTPVLSTSGYIVSKIPSQTLGGANYGYTISESSLDEIIDENKDGPDDIDGLGTIRENPGVGWFDNNRMLLSYAAGDTVGQATKWFQTYTFVNLGDPVAHVNHGRLGTQIDGLDQTLGTEIADSRRSEIRAFFHKDMDHDNREDIIVQYIDGYVELFLNINGTFHSRGMIAYLPRLGTLPLEFGDFQGDGYADMITLDQSGSLLFLANNNRRFSEQSIQVTGGDTPTSIQQLRVYDMDADGKDDIVYLTSYGELGILYGTATAGNFDKNILDSSLGLSLSTDPIKTGGAFYGSNVRQIPNLGHDDPSATDLTDARIFAQAYYQDNKILSSDSSTVSLEGNGSQAMAGIQELIDQNAAGISQIEQYMGSTNITNQGDIPEVTNAVLTRTFVRSEYAEVEDMDITKRYSTVHSGKILPYDVVQVTITLKNNGKAITGAEYLDTLSSIFEINPTTKYRVTTNGASTERTMEFESFGDYDVRFLIGDIPAGDETQITYMTKLLPVSYGEMMVGNFEEKTLGNDDYGDVAFQTSTTCGAEAIQWLSSAARTYNRTDGAQSIPASLPFPASVAEKIVDVDHNGIPDSIENQSLAKQQAQYNEMTTESSETNADILQVTRNGDTNFSIGFDENSLSRIEDMASDIFNGLACGFGGGGCMSFPINWAPLAPGNDPVVFGNPVGDGFNVEEGLPIFSALTGVPIYGPWGCYVMPFVWPPSPIGLGYTCLSNDTSAGGYLGATDPNNFIRIFMTPTLTLGLGTAICFGGSAVVKGAIPPAGLYPLVQGGNCIIMTESMNMCKGDGSAEDGDVTGISGLGNTTDAWNAASCTLKVGTSPEQQAQDATLTNDIIHYIKNPSPTSIAGLSVRISERNISSLGGGPLLNIGSGDAATKVDVSLIGNGNIADISSVINVKNKRVAAFPDFLMDWLTRQTEELTNSLFTAPNLTIIPPTDFGQNAKVDRSYSTFMSDISNAYSKQNLDNLRSQMIDSYNNTNVAGSLAASQASAGNSVAGAKYGGIASNMITSNASTINTVAGSLNALKSAYTFIGKLPFVRITQTKVNINVPWILPGELDQYERKLREYSHELDQTSASWCVDDPSEACLKNKAKINASGLQNSITQNLKRIEEYRNFPDKLQKYVTWKQRYLYQILCNIESLERMTFGWLYDNGIRFQKWAELYALIKAIASSWQPLVDIFANTSAQCGVCRNERYDAQDWKYKLISMLIPEIPVITFPKWPDIILDLSDVRLGMNISVPEFNFRITPIRLPNLPDFSLPSAPNLSITLPDIPVLPPIPDLPDLPDLPSLPTFKLPDLPPPPKIPKLAGAIAGFLKILSLISKMYCYYQNTMLVPEWQAGDVIAQRTERQGTLPFDFLDLQLPQFSLPSIREIRIATHLNLELKSDFITEFAKTAVKPINNFSTDISSSIPSQIGSDVNIDGIPNQSIDLRSSLDDLMASLDADNEVFLNTDEFQNYVKNELLAVGYTDRVYDLDQKIAAARAETTAVTDELRDYNTRRFELIREFISEQENTLSEMQNVIDLLRIDPSENTLLSYTGTGIFAKKLASDTTLDSRALSQLDNLEASSAKIPQSADSDLDFYKNSLTKKVDRLAANTAIETANPNVTYPYTSTAANYKPVFEGIYVLTDPSETQTRLFAYTDLVDDATVVDVMDIDLDGDRDYLYVLGGILYLKATHTHEPQKTEDLSRVVREIPASAPTPYVPNYFAQDVSVPGELRIHFQNALPGETNWRLELYDRYLEWDYDAIGTHDAATTPKTVIDLFTTPRYPDYENGVRSVAVPRSLAYGYNQSDFILESGRIQVLNSPIYISLSPNRSIYTGDNAVNITYQNANSDQMQTMRLDPHREYQFDVTTEIRSNDGPLFIIQTGVSTDRYTASDDLKGLPLLPGMQITSDRAVRILDTATNSTYDMSAEGTYITESLGAADQAEYYFTLPYPNGYYYARLGNKTTNYTDRAGVELLAPQRRSDIGAPVVSIENNMRIPVYQSRMIHLEDVITELSDYTVSMDVDTTQDENNNGVYDDDFVTSGANMSIQGKELTLGSFDTLGKRSIVLRVTDEFGNTTLVPITIEVYAPIPYISSVNRANQIFTISGALNEPLQNEPIHFWRIRTSESPTLLGQDPTMTLSGGIYSTEYTNPPESIAITASGDTIQIGAHGAFTALPTNYSIQVAGANSTAPMLVSVQNSLGERVYEQIMIAPKTTPLIDTTVTSGSGILITPETDTLIVRANYNDPTLPGGMYIASSAHIPYAAIAKDGNIFVLDPDVTLEWQRDAPIPTIFIKKSSVLIATIVYDVDFFYTAK